MTPAQLAQLGEYIASQPDLDAPATPDGSFAIAERLNAPAGVAIRSRFVTARTVLAEIGPGGAVILDKLEAVAAVSSPVKWAMRFITQDSGIDIGHPGTQGMIDQLVAGNALTADEGAALKGLALLPITRAESVIDGYSGTVSYQDVDAARNM